VVSLGNYDGMHRGHQFLITQLVAKAQAQGLKSAAITFEPHPAQVHRPEAGLVRLQPLEARLAAMAELGLDAVLVEPYNLEFAALTPFEFVQRYLVQALGAVEVVVGHDVRFGAGNSGDLAELRGIGQQLNFTVTALDDQGDADESTPTRWSSTQVRESLAQGDAAHAGRILGRPHRMTGTVVHGDGRGHTLGFPTANLGGEMTGLIPADGVYAGWLERLDRPEGQADRRFPAAISVGTNPTFGGTVRRVEAFVPGRIDLELYGERVAVDFAARLRHTLNFSSVTALVTQLHDDAAQALRVLAGLAASPGDNVG
jgi:riboflavin kinase/FMN adenylyltransferase